MADRQITAQMVIDAKDNTGDTFAKLAGKLDNIAKNSKASASVHDLANQLANLDAQAKALTNLDTAMTRVGKSRTEFRAAEAAVKNLGAAMRAAGNPTREMVRAYEQAQRHVSRTSAELDRHAAAAIGAKRQVEGLGFAAGRLAMEQDRVARSIDVTSRALERQMAVERRHLEMAPAIERAARQREHAQARTGAVHMATQAAAAAVSAHSVVRGIEKSLEAGSDLQDTRLNLKNPGIDPKTAAHIEQYSLDLSRQFPNVKQTAIMDLAKEARSVLKSPEEVESTTGMLAAAKAVLDAGHPGGERSQGLGMLVKGSESIGAAQNPERLRTLIDAYVKAIQVMGETISPEQIYEFDKYAKQAGARMSDRFLMTTGLSLAQEMGGSTVGNDIAQVQRAITGGFANKHIPLKEMARVDLINRDDLDLTKTGEAKGIKAGHKGVHGANLAASDLDLWVYKFLLPALEKHGMKSQEDQLNWVSKVFTGNQADVISKLITQRQSFEYHAGMYPKASGLAGAQNLPESATAGIAAFDAALTNLMGNVTSAAMEPIGKALYGLAGHLNSLAQAAKDNPLTALTVGGGAAAAALGGSGYMAYQLYNGFGLKTSALALDGSAEALTLAAGRLGVGGLPGGLGPTGPAAAAGGGGISAWLLGKMGLAEGGIGNLGFWAAMAAWASRSDMPTVDPNFIHEQVKDRPHIWDTAPDNPGAMRPADAYDRARDRQSAIDDMLERIEQSTVHFGQLDSAVSSATAKLLALANFGGDSGGGGGIIQASYSGGGGFGGGGSFGGGSSGTPGWWTEERQQHAIAVLKAGGVSDLGAQALVSRWANVESRGGPSSVNPKSGAHGIAQWLTRHPAGSRGDFDAQLGAVVSELNSTESRAMRTLNSARTPWEAATGASAFERAEGYNARTGTDNFTGRTAAGIHGHVSVHVKIDQDGKVRHKSIRYGGQVKPSVGAGSTGPTYPERLSI